MEGNMKDIIKEIIQDTKEYERFCDAILNTEWDDPDSERTADAVNEICGNAVERIIEELNISNDELFKMLNYVAHNMIRDMAE